MPVRETAMSAPVENATDRALARLMANGGTYVLYALLAIVVLFPLLWVLLGSFRNQSELFTYPTTIWPRVFTWNELHRRSDEDQHRDQSQEHHHRHGRHARSDTVTGHCRCLWLCSMGFPLQGHGAADSAGVPAYPSSVNLVPYYVMMNKLSLLNTHLGLILIYTSTHIPFTIWILKGFFERLPISLDEAAMMDGCSRWRVFWNILLPLSLPGISAAGFLVALAAWSEFLIPLAIANNQQVAVMSLGIYNFFGINNFLYNYAFAASVISTVPTILLYLFAQRYLVSGLTAGAEK